MSKIHSSEKLADIPVVSAAWLERLQHRQCSSVPDLWDLLDTVKDPEVPVLSLWDLGVLCNIERNEGGKVTVTITPTYSGCPAIDAMRQDISKTLGQAGIVDFSIALQLSPAWTTDWLSPEGRDKLRQFGIAPPQREVCGKAIQFTPEHGIDCPRCGSSQTQLISEFGSTACKALFQCHACHEPFDYFKHL